MGKGFFKLPHFLKKLLSHPSVILQAAFRLERPTRVYLGLLLSLGTAIGMHRSMFSQRSGSELHL